MWTGRGRQSISCVYTQGRGARQVCAVSPQATTFCLTQIGSTLFAVSLIFFHLVSSLHSCGAKHVFVLQSSVRCWKSLGSELRLLTDGRVPLWPWHPAFLRNNTHLCGIRGETEKPRQEGLTSEGGCFDLAGSLSVSLFRFSCFHSSSYRQLQAL